MPVAHHPTEVVMHPEQDEIGNVKEEVPLLQTAAKAMEATKTVSTQELVVAWVGGEPEDGP